MYHINDLLLKNLNYWPLISEILCLKWRNKTKVTTANKFPSPDGSVNPFIGAFAGGCTIKKKLQR
jgi:hypothetical protein